MQVNNGYKTARDGAGGEADCAPFE
jgi:hypothetical protein